MIQGPLRRMKESGEDELWHEVQGLLQRVERERPDLLERILKVVSGKIGGNKYAGVDTFYEKVFMKEGRSFTPRVAAQMCRRYLRFPSKMMPFLIKRAQRVKHRVYMRTVRMSETEKRRVFGEIS